MIGRLFDALLADCLNCLIKHHVFWLGNDIIILFTFEIISQKIKQNPIGKDKDTTSWEKEFLKKFYSVN